LKLHEEPAAKASEIPSSRLSADLVTTSSLSASPRLSSNAFTRLAEAHQLQDDKQRATHEQPLRDNQAAMEAAEAAIKEADELADSKNRDGVPEESEEKNSKNREAKEAKNDQLSVASSEQKGEGKTASLTALPERSVVTAKDAKDPITDIEIKKPVCVAAIRPLPLDHLRGRTKLELISHLLMNLMFRVVSVDTEDSKASQAPYVAVADALAIIIKSCSNLKTWVQTCASTAPKADLRTTDGRPVSRDECILHVLENSFLGMCLPQFLISFYTAVYHHRRVMNVDCFDKVGTLLSLLDELNAIFPELRDSDAAFLQHNASKILDPVGKLVVESAHNYISDVKKQVVRIRGAQMLVLEFDPRCSTEISSRGEHDALHVFVGESNLRVGDKNTYFYGKALEHGGRDWPSKRIFVPGDSISYKFDAKHLNKRWGFRFVVTGFRVMNSGRPDNAPLHCLLDLQNITARLYAKCVRLQIESLPLDPLEKPSAFGKHIINPFDSSLFSVQDGPKTFDLGSNEVDEFCADLVGSRQDSRAERLYQVNPFLLLREGGFAHISPFVCLSPVSYFIRLPEFLPKSKGNSVPN
jgi:hypothetical protein